MDAPPPTHRFLADIGLAIIGGLISILLTVVGWFTKQLHRDVAEIRDRVQTMEVRHEACVTRDELDRKFNIMQDNQERRHSENLDAIRELRDNTKDVHKRIDDVLRSRT